MSGVTQTSKQAYYTNAPKKVTQRGKILRLLNMHPEGLTRNQIKRMLHLPINAVCGRVNELISFNLVKEYSAAPFDNDSKHTRVDEVTGMRNSVVYPVKPYI